MRACAGETQLPELTALGRDLFATTPAQRRLALGRTFLGLLAFALAAYAEWWLTRLLVFLIFVAVVTVTQDVVHSALGLSRRGTEWALFVMGAVLLESGHAYRLTHCSNSSQTADRVPTCRSVGKPGFGFLFA
jgi:beta-carotene hydroxylase